MVSPFARHFGARPRTPAWVPVRLEFADRTLWDGVSIIFCFMLLSVRKSEQNSSHRESLFQTRRGAPQVRTAAFAGRVARRTASRNEDFPLQVEPQLGAQTKAPRQPGRSQISSSQIFRRQAWSAGPPGLCWSSRSGSPEASSPLGSRGPGRCAGARSPGSHP
jgi:hypothetical protein